jgi:hypothetical protein
VRLGRLALCAGLVLAPLWLGQSAQAREGDANLPLFPYAKQSKFVTEPARFLSAPFYEIGFMTGAIICLPVSIAQDPHQDGSVPHDKEASIVCGKGLGTGIGWPVYAAIGLPLLIGQELFWTGPRAIVSLFHKTPTASAAPQAP